MGNDKTTMTVVKLVIVLFSVMLLVSGGTFAYWTWSSQVDKNVVFNTMAGVDKYIVYDEGSSSFVGNFQPTDTFCESTSTTLSFYKTSEAADINLTATVNMDINSIGANIAMSDDVYWVVTAGDSGITCTDGLSSGDVVSYGTFEGETAGETIDVLQDVTITESKQTFTVWIWIDALGSGLSSLSGETIDTNVWTEINMVFENNISPVLDNGMIPVTIANDGTVTTILKNDDNWYNYEEKQWANVILVNDTSRSLYQNTTGVEVNQDDILAYYVWIPRYKYRIPKITCSSIPEEDRNMEDYPECYAPYTMSAEDKTKLVAYWEAEHYCIGDESHMNDALNAVNYALENGEFTYSFYYTVSILSWINEYNNGSVSNCGAPDGTISITASNFNESNTLYGAGSEVSIEIEFESADKIMTMGNAVTTYRSHPSFWWDNDSDGIVDNGEILSGIWVGKFETTPDKSSTCYVTPSYTDCNNTTQNPTILPNEASLRYQNIDNQFATSQRISMNKNTYGINDTLTNAHMMKNSEWGAVAYLSHSKYGINEEVRFNNYWNSTNNKYILTGCGAATSSTINRVTTCSIAYGSGVSEYPQSTTGNISGIFDMSGGAWEYVMGNYGNQTNTYFLTLPDSKYYDVYLKEQFKGYLYGNIAYCTLETCGGHSLSETAGWYSDYARFIDSDYTWFMRGGNAGAGIGAGIFDFSYYNGYGDVRSWRSVIINGFGV